MQIFKIEKPAIASMWADKEIDWPAQCAAEEIALQTLLPLVYWHGEDKGSGVGSMIYQWQGRWYFEGINYTAEQSPFHELGYAFMDEDGYETLDALYNDSSLVLRAEIRTMMAELKQHGFN